MMRTQISFEPSMYRQAQREARALGISLAELVRRALSIQLDTLRSPQRMAKQPWMEFTGVIHGGPGESDAKDMDRVVYGRKL